MLPVPCLLYGSLLLATCRAAPVTGPEVSVAQRPAAALHDTRWVLRTLYNQPAPSPAEGRELYLLLRATELQTEGQAGCNRFWGAYQLPAAGQLRFGPLLSTRMACPALATETAFLRALENTRTYQISGDTLRLFGEASAQPAAVLHAVTYALKEVKH